MLAWSLLTDGSVYQPCIGVFMDIRPDTSMVGCLDVRLPCERTIDDTSCDGEKSIYR